MITGRGDRVEFSDYAALDFSATLQSLVNTSPDGAGTDISVDRAIGRDGNSATVDVLHDPSLALALQAKIVIDTGPDGSGTNVSVHGTVDLSLRGSRQ